MSISLIVDPQDQDNLPGNPDNVLKDLKEATTNPAVPAQPEATTPTEPQVPEKYRGKSLEDVIDMHRNLESAYGRMANDLGTQRQLTDQLLELKREQDLQNNSPDPLPQVTSGDLLDNPQETLEKLIEAKTSQNSKAALDRVQALEATLAQERFLTHHSDVNEITSSDGFNSWLSRSPLRMRDAQIAASGDWTVADALLSEYKEYQALTQTNAEPNNPQAVDPLKAARDAALEGRGQSSSGNAAKPNGKIYRRADLIQLRLADPEAYNDPTFQAEIVAAYRDGRVK